jgi:hypothetical protein
LGELEGAEFFDTVDEGTEDFDFLSGEEEVLFLEFS